jgi:S1-C subfamily serine protease
MPVNLLTANPGLPEQLAREVAEAAAPACGVIRASGFLTAVAGTGFQVPTFLVTAKHVVESYLVGDTGEVVPWTRIKVLPLVNEGHEYETGVERVVANYDIAFLQPVAELQTVTLGEADQLEVGDSVVVLGAAETLGPSLPTIPYAGLGQVHSLAVTTPEVFQYTVPIMPGASGGPVLNMQGQVVGMNVIALTVGERVYGIGLKAEAIQAALEGRTYSPPPLTIITEHIILPIAVGVGVGLLVLAVRK